MCRCHQRGPQETESSKFFKSRNWYYWQIERKKWMKKMGLLFLFSMFHFWFMVLKMSKIVRFLLIFSWLQQILCLDLWYENKLIRKILLSSIRKWYGLLDSELPFRKYPDLKSSAKITFSLYFFKFWRSYLLNHTSELNKPYHFLKQKNDNFSDELV